VTYDPNEHPTMKAAQMHVLVEQVRADTGGQRRGSIEAQNGSSE
jgi:hypothetical protein